MRQLKTISLPLYLVSLWYEKLYTLCSIHVCCIACSSVLSFQWPFFHYLTKRPHYECNIFGNDFNIITQHCFCYIYMYILYVYRYASEVNMCRGKMWDIDALLNYQLQAWFNFFFMHSVLDRGCLILYFLFEIQRWFVFVVKK